MTTQLFPIEDLATSGCADIGIDHTIAPVKTGMKQHPVEATLDN